MQRLLALMFLASVLLVACKKQEKKHALEENTILTYRGTEIPSQVLTNFLQGQMDSLGISALSIAVINEGKIAYNKSLGFANLDKKIKVNDESIFEAASLSKPVFAYFVMRLTEKYIIDLDRPLFFYLPDESMEVDQRYKNVSARLVLSHNTGFPNWRWFDEIPEGIDINRGDFFMVQDPNSSFSYSGEAYQYLARVVAHLNFVNMNELGTLFQREISEPLGIEHFYFVWDDYVGEHKVSGHRNNKVTNRDWSSGLPHHNSKVFQAAGGLHTNAENYGILVCDLINQEFLMKETYREMLSSYTEIDEENPNHIEDGVTSWGLGFGIRPVNNDTIYLHGGNNNDFQSELLFSINRKFGYVFFVNCDGGDKLNKAITSFLEIPKN